MNRKAAFKILNLDANASLEDAKKAYRDLAKKFHPDVVRKNQSSEKNTEAKMKEINLAFYSLASQLKAKEIIKKPIKKSNDVKETVKDRSKKYEEKESFSFLINMSRLVLSFFNKNNKFRNHKKTVEKDTLKTKFKNRNVFFADVLKSVHKDISNGRKKSSRNKRNPYSKKTESYMRYQKYMAMKRKIQSRQTGKNQDMSIGRVEKIDPVEPVNRVRH